MNSGRPSIRFTRTTSKHANAKHAKAATLRRKTRSQIHTTQNPASPHGFSLSCQAIFDAWISRKIRRLRAQNPMPTSPRNPDLVKLTIRENELPTPSARTILRAY